MLDLIKIYVNFMKRLGKETLEFVMSYPSWWRGKNNKIFLIEK
jgi:hypothetical protein